MTLPMRVYSRMRLTRERALQLRRYCEIAGVKLGEDE